MKLKTEKCANCFSAKAEIISHWAYSADMAARIYGSVHETGYLPAMCQQDKGRYFICYEPKNASPPRLDVWP